MTNDEFAKWMNRLWVAFPATKKWFDELEHSDETQRVWRDCLGPYSFQDCLEVLADWSTGQLDAFKAYERDKVHLLIRAVCEGNRSKQRRREESQRLFAQGRRRAGDFASGIAATLGGSGSPMVAAFQELKPLHEQHLDGELSVTEYAMRKDEILAKHGIVSEKSEEHAWTG